LGCPSEEIQNIVLTGSAGTESMIPVVAGTASIEVAAHHFDVLLWACVHPSTFIFSP
jgi:hypothetical protein